MGNVCTGKTMLERYSKSAQATEDVAIRLVNSGIKNDSRIVEPYLKVYSKTNYNDSIMIATKDQNRLVDNTPKNLPTLLYRNKFASMLC